MRWQMKPALNLPACRGRWGRVRHCHGVDWPLTWIMLRSEGIVSAQPRVLRPQSGFTQMRSGRPFRMPVAKKDLILFLTVSTLGTTGLWTS